MCEFATYFLNLHNSIQIIKNEQYINN